MATPGYEPYQALWHFFHQSGDFERALTTEERSFIEKVIHTVNESVHRAPVDGFMRLMHEEGRDLDPLNRDVVAGLLQCLEPSGDYSKSEELPLGIYDHFKGGVYLIKGFSRWASGNGEKVVEYLSMIFGTPHTRLADQWCEVVQWPDGKYRSRFVYRGPDLKSPVPSFKVPSPKV